MTLELGADAAVDPAAEDLKGALIEANEGRPVDVVLEMSGGRVFDAVRRGARAVRPDRGLRDRGPRAEHARDRPADEEEPRVVGFWLMHCLGRRDMMEEPLRDLFERAARGELVPQMGDHLRALGRAAGARGHAGPAHERKAPARPLPLASGPA